MMVTSSMNLAYSARKPDKAPLWCSQNGDPEQATKLPSKPGRERGALVQHDRGPSLALLRFREIPADSLS
jgi:hypothetical protein